MKLKNVWNESAKFLQIIKKLLYLQPRSQRHFY
jgi:hypothetical protein